MGGATLASVIVSEVLMQIISQGMNAQGLFVSIAMPVLLGTPMLTYMLVRQQQLKGQQPQSALGNITPEQMMLLNKMQQLMGNNQP